MTSKHSAIIRFVVLAVTLVAEVHAASAARPKFKAYQDYKSPARAVRRFVPGSESPRTIQTREGALVVSKGSGGIRTHRVGKEIESSYDLSQMAIDKARGDLNLGPDAKLEVDRLTRSHKGIIVRAGERRVRVPIVGYMELGKTAELREGNIAQARRKTISDRAYEIWDSNERGPNADADWARAEKEWKDRVAEGRKKRQMAQSNR
jgi:hypothetical protein